MRWSLLARAVGGVVCLAGCAALAGIDDGDPHGKAPGDANDGGGNVPLGEGGGPSEGGGFLPDGAPCAAGNAVESAAVLHAQHVQPQAPVKLDGAGDEWACVDRFAFTGGQRVMGLVDGRGVADIAIQWDEQHLYVLANVVTASPTADAGRLQNFNNDSLSVFVVGPTPGTTYTANDHHIAIDSAGLVADYAIGARTSVAGIAAAVSTPVDSGGFLKFTIELQIDASIFRGEALKAADRIGMNFQINDAPDVANHYRVWFVDPAKCTKLASCTVSGTSEPYCDPRCMGEVVLR